MTPPLLLLLALGFPAGEVFPLGPLGARAEVTAESSAAVVLEVRSDGPAAAAGLVVGDAIVGAGGSEFGAHSSEVDAGGDGPQRGLGEALDEFYAARWTEDGPRELSGFELVVERGGERVTLALELPARAPLSGPGASLGRAELRTAAAAQLVRTQLENGSWDSPVGLTGDRVLSAWALVGLIGHGDARHRDAIGRAAAWLRGPEERAWLRADPLEKGPDNLGNWALTATVVALAEHHLLTGDPADPPVIERCLSALTARMTAEGRFGHDVTVGYDGKGFNVINTLYHLAVAMGEAAGVEADPEAWERSMAQLRASVSENGGVRYWTLAGTGTGDATLRTSALALALQVSGREAPLVRRLTGYLDTHAARAREAHAVGSMGMLLNPPALWIAGDGAHGRFLEEWRWYLTLLREPDDRLRYIGGKRNNGGDGYLGQDRIAAIIALQLCCCEDARLRMHRSAVPRENDAQRAEPGTEEEEAGQSSGGSVRSSTRSK